MSFLDGFRNLFSGKEQGGGRDANRVYIVDVERMVESRDGGDRSIGPVDRVQALQRLSRFVEREKINVQAVLAGRPLREVSHGGVYNGIQVYYAEQPSAVSDLVLNLARESGRGDRVVVITSDREAEEKARSLGNGTLRVSTLRKALEGGGNENEQFRGQPRRGGRSRFGGRRPPQQSSQEQRPQQQQTNEQSQDRGDRGSSEPGGDTTVKNLIDLVE